VSEVATVTLNAALDRTLHVGRLELGRVHVVSSEHVQAGGKGVNVARVLRALGVAVKAIVVVGGPSGREIVDDLERSSLPNVPIEAPGESRTCLEIVERGSARATQLHGQGVEGSRQVVDRVVEAVEALPESVSWLAISGSLPPGMPVDAVRRVADAARGRRFRVAVDTRGPALGEAWSVRPELVRVNRDELAEVLGADEETLPVPPYPELGAPGLGVVSHGRAPFMAWLEDGTRWSVTPPRVDVVNAIGCGDSMLAGLLASLIEEVPAEAALRSATALAAAEATSLVAGRTDIALARSLETGVRITRAA
jgi:1-phosphofructokinase family hexose kinase